MAGGWTRVLLLPYDQLMRGVSGVAKFSPNTSRSLLQSWWCYSVQIVALPRELTQNWGHQRNLFLRGGCLTFDLIVLLVFSDLSLSSVVFLVFLIFICE